MCPCQRPVDTGLALNALAENRSTVACAHIQVDTGMGFGGFLGQLRAIEEGLNFERSGGLVAIREQLV